MARAPEERIAQTYSRLTRDFDQREKTKDLVDQLLDITLNDRQSGHLEGSRSKAHTKLITLLTCQAAHAARWVGAYSAQVARAMAASVEWNPWTRPASAATDR
jgi:hypothetical protein